MKRLELKTSFELPAELLWHTWFFDNEFRDELNRLTNVVANDEELEYTGQGPDLVAHRELNMDVDRDVPRPLLKLVRGATRVREITDFDAAKGALVVTLGLPVIGRRVDYGYRITWNVEGDVTHVTWDGYVDVHLPRLSGPAERFLMKELVQATRDCFDFVDVYFARRSA